MSGRRRYIGHCVIIVMACVLLTSCTPPAKSAAKTKAKTGKNSEAEKPRWQRQVSTTETGLRRDQLSYSGTIESLPFGESRDMLQLAQGALNNGQEKSIAPPQKTISSQPEAIQGMAAPAAHPRRESYFVRRDRILHLSTQPDRRQLPMLIATLTDRGDPLSWLAARAVGKTGGAQAIQALTRACQDKRPQVRQAALGGLVDLRAPAAGAICRKFLRNDDNRAVRSAAAIGLGVLADSAAAPALYLAMTKDVQTVAFSAAWGLGLLRDQRGIDQLIEYVNSGETAIAPIAIRALGSLKHPTAIPPIYGALYARRKPVRQTARLTLARIPEATRTAALGGLIRTDRERFMLRFALLQYLAGAKKKLPPATYAQTQLGSLDDRLLALACLVKGGPTRGVAQVIALLNDPRKELARAAQQGIRPLVIRLDLPGVPGSSATQADWQVWWFRLHRLLAVRPGKAILRLPDGSRQEITRDHRLAWRIPVRQIHLGRGQKGMDGAYVLVYVGAQPVRIGTTLNF